MMRLSGDCWRWSWRVFECVLGTSKGARRGGLGDKIGNGEDFRGVVRFFTAEIALWPNHWHDELPSIATGTGH